MTDRVIPLTAPGPLWSQREYVECMKIGVGFAAHRHREIHQAFHYHFPNGIGCSTVLINGSCVMSYIDHDFTPGINWIEQCSAALHKRERA